MFWGAVADLPSSPTLPPSFNISATQTCLKSPGRPALGLLDHSGWYSVAFSLLSAPLFPLRPQNFYSSFMNNRKSHLFLRIIS